jgi:Holliday junction resolvasome RuvABC endonuclease subunit
VSLAKLKTQRSNSVLGIDASTKSIAFCLFDSEAPVKWGEIFFSGSNVYERVLDAKRKTRQVRELFPTDFVAIEAAVMVRSANTAIKMAYIFGAIMGELIDDHRKVIEVHPITWQSYIGNKNFTKAQKQVVYDEFPGKTKSWYSGHIRKMRKQATIDFCHTLGVYTDSDNVADACGIGWYAHNNLVRNA